VTPERILSEYKDLIFFDLMLLFNVFSSNKYNQNKSGFFGGPAYFIRQSEQFKKYSKSSDWLEKTRLSKKSTFVLIM